MEKQRLANGKRDQEKKVNGTVSICQEEQDTFRSPTTGPGKKWQSLGMQSGEGYRAASLLPWGGHRGFWSWVNSKRPLGVPAPLSTPSLTHCSPEMIIREATQLCSVALCTDVLSSIRKKLTHTGKYQSTRHPSRMSLP